MLLSCGPKGEDHGENYHSALIYRELKRTDFMVVDNFLKDLSLDKQFICDLTDKTAAVIQLQT